MFMLSQGLTNGDWPMRDMVSLRIDREITDGSSLWLLEIDGVFMLEYLIRFWLLVLLVSVVFLMESL